MLSIYFRFDFPKYILTIGTINKGCYSEREVYMRITMNHVRGIGSKDNDRNSKDNISWCIYRGMSFEEAELKFYEEHFRARLNQINANYCLDRHQDRCKTMEQFT